MCNFKSIMAAVTLSTLATASFATEAVRGWTVDPAMSSVAFGSIKNDYAGETHRFSDVTGTVDQKGNLAITVGLASLETMIDIRNERMAEFVFQNAPSAQITAELDMAALAALPVGDATTLETYGTLNLLGTDTELDATFFVMRLSADKVLVTSDGMIMLATEDTAFDAGIDKLQELASLDGIMRVSPVTLRLVFDADM